MARWLDYEKMIADIYRELAPSATVTHNDKIVGEDSRVERQIDVTIRESAEEQDLLIAVQAKDYKNPVDINTVGEFASVLRDIRATKGILICNAGFTKGALGLARSWGIDLCSAHDAEKRNWANDISIPVLWIDVSPTAQLFLKVYLEVGDSISQNPMEWLLSTDRGQTRLKIFENFVEYWNGNKIPKASGLNHHITMENTGVELMVGPQKWQRVEDFLMAYTVSKRGWLKYFSPIEFRGIKNHLTEEVNFSRLRLGFRPFNRDDDWVEMPDPDQIIIDTKGLIVTSENLTISLDDIDTFKAHFRLLDNE